MARATTRHQQGTKPSQVPTQQSRSQRTRQQSHHDESEEEEPPDEDELGNEEDEDDQMAADDAYGNEIKRKAKELVRLALFTERRRAHLRREDINKKVLGPHSRSFNMVFSLAQETLRKTFGMELVELQTRAGFDEDATDPNSHHDELHQARNATVLRKKVATLGTKTYILRSTLDPIIIEQASLTDEQVLEEDMADLPSDSEDDDDAYTSRLHGSIISWGSTDQLGALGILYTILALILVSGRVLNDLELRAHLKHLRLSPTSYIPTTSQSTQKSQTLLMYLSTLIRQGYLERVQIGDVKNKGKSKTGAGIKRGRVAFSQANDDGDDQAEGGAAYEWRWGSRAQSEVGEQAVAQFIAEFMVGGEGADEEEEEEEEEEEGGRGRGRGRARRANVGRGDAESKLDKMMKGIERAAGGQLADIK